MKSAREVGAVSLCYSSHAASTDMQHDLFGSSLDPDMVQNVALSTMVSYTRSDAPRREGQAGVRIESLAVFSSIVICENYF